MLAMNISEYSQCAVCRQNNEQTRVKWVENLTFSILFFYCRFKLGMPVSAVELNKQQVLEKQVFFFFSSLYLLLCILQKDNYFDLFSFEICWNTVRKLLLSHSIKKIGKEVIHQSMQYVAVITGLL